ncbi:MAG: magnesium chelatase subunit H [Cyanobacteria bacterium]|jgi:cobaltochelatase CobN/magnesium chelatase subunit H|nr:magnesium chelatase subunit H [Cyanobacteria bacterium GSL.Bin1]
MPSVRITAIAPTACLGDLEKAVARLQTENSAIELETFSLRQIQEGLIARETVLESIQSAMWRSHRSTSIALLFDLRGNPDRALALVREALEATADTNIAFIPLFGGSPAIMGLVRMGNFAPAKMPPAKSMETAIAAIAQSLPPETARQAQNWSKCVTYWTNSGMDNLVNLLRFVASEYGGMAMTVEDPIIYPDFGFMDLQTGTRYTSYEAYLQDHPLDSNLPTVAVIFYSGTTLTSNLQGGAELLQTLQQQANLLPFFSDGIATADAIQEHLFRNGFPVCDGIVSLLRFRLDGGPLGGNPEKTINLLQQFNVPYVVPLSANNQDLDEWHKSAIGLGATETLSLVSLPEMDGAIDSVMLYGVKNEMATPIPGRGEKVAHRLLNRITLKQKPNAEKRVAIVIFDYPPGEGTLGTASFLDVFASVEAILNRLQEVGYQVTPPAAGTLKDSFLEKGLVHNGEFTSIQLTAENAVRVPLQQYRQWYQKLPAALRESTEAVFGDPPGDLMTYEGDILLAAMEFGNAIVAVQPSRGIHEDPAKIHHDDSLPPHHQYIALYRWLEESANVDAIVHIGTHGTFEFLPGKQVALAAEDAPDALLGDLPHLYVYHVVNVSEGTIAKRRSYAQLVSYASPTFAPAGLYAELSQLEDTIAEYEEMKIKSLPRRVAILDQIIALCQEQGLPFPLPETLSRTNGIPDDFSPYEEALEELHHTLFEWKRSAIPIGLHSFGQTLTGEGLINYLNLVGRYDRAEISSLPRTLAQSKGWDYDHLLDRADPKVESLAGESWNLIARLLEGKAETVTEDFKPITSYLKDLAERIKNTDEIGALLHALDGGYLEPGMGGDPVRSPHTYPTGRNTFQFDPTKLPTDSAYDRGAQIAEETLTRYYQENGTYPESVGVILWGFETCKTFGETVGQVLHYIGVKVDRGRGYFMKPVVVPLSELGRPRIDVTINICGFFRDLFPNLVNLIDEAFQTVAELDEPMELNAVRRHVCALQPKLGDTPEGKKLAAGRLFGPPPGEYGNRLSTLIETAAWEEAADLGRNYLERTQYLYGREIPGTESRTSLEAALANTQIISQVRDCHEFEVTDLDHYYEFFGGMAQATAVVTGKRPDVLIADTTGERISVKSLNQAVQKGVSTRLLNPKWIEGMLQHDHKGGQQIADRVEYLLGLDATTGSVGENTWRKVAQHFVFDQAMRERLQANNPYATAEIVQKLGEANYRGYWQPTETETEQLKEVYREIERAIELGEGKSNENS